jgi:hypothetical protein
MVLVWCNVIETFLRDNWSDCFAEPSPQTCRSSNRQNSNLLSISKPPRRSGSNTRIFPCACRQSARMKSGDFRNWALATFRCRAVFRSLSESEADSEPDLRVRGLLVRNAMVVVAALAGQIAQLPSTAQVVVDRVNRVWVPARIVVGRAGRRPVMCHNDVSLVDVASQRIGRAGTDGYCSAHEGCNENGLELGQHRALRSLPPT